MNPRNAAGTSGYVMPPQGIPRRPGPAHSLLARLGPGEVVEGGYRLQFLVLRHRKDRPMVWHGRFADRSGTIDAYRPADGVQVDACLPRNALVFAGFSTQLYNGRLVASLHDLDLLGAEAAPAFALDRLPRPAAHLPEALDRLAELMAGLSSDALRGALQRLFLEDALMLDWIARPDNLCARSVAAAMVAPEGIGRLFPDPNARDTAIAACLMRSMGALAVQDGTAPGPRRALARCAPALDWLAGVDPTTARRLRRLLGEPGGRPEPELLAVLAAVAGAEGRAGVRHSDLRTGA